VLARRPRFLGACDEQDASSRNQQTTITLRHPHDSIDSAKDARSSFLSVRFPFCPSGSVRGGFRAKPARSTRLVPSASNGCTRRPDCVVTRTIAIGPRRECGPPPEASELEARTPLFHARLRLVIPPSKRARLSVAPWAAQSIDPNGSIGMSRSSLPWSSNHAACAVSSNP
jgi:hypothetical protein